MNQLCQSKDLKQGYRVYTDYVKIKKRPKKHFFWNQVFLAVFIILIVFSYTLKSFSINKAVDPIRTTESYLVKPGDTLWTIAIAFKQPQEDPREYIANIMKLNDLNSSMIYVGQDIKIYFSE